MPAILSGIVVVQMTRTMWPVHWHAECVHSSRSAFGYLNSPAVPSERRYNREERLPPWPGSRPDGGPDGGTPLPVRSPLLETMWEIDMVLDRRIRMIVVDDHPVVRDGIRELLNHFSDFHVVGKAGDGAEAVRLAAELGPEVIIMDVLMPERDGIDACREIMDLLPGTRVLMLTASTAPQAVVESVARRCRRVPVEGLRSRGTGGGRPGGCRGPVQPDG